jgi:hypothetical protein
LTSEQFYDRRLGLSPTDELEPALRLDFEFSTPGDDIVPWLLARVHWLAITIDSEKSMWEIYVVWRKTLGQIGPGLVAVGNGNGMADGGNLVVWRRANRISLA